MARNDATKHERQEGEYKTKKEKVTHRSYAEDPQEEGKKLKEQNFFELDSQERELRMFMIIRKIFAGAFFTILTSALSIFLTILVAALGILLVLFLIAIVAKMAANFISDTVAHWINIRSPFENYLVAIHKEYLTYRDGKYDESKLEKALDDIENSDKCIKDYIVIDVPTLMATYEIYFRDNGVEITKNSPKEEFDKLDKLVAVLRKNISNDVLELIKYECSGNTDTLVNYFNEHSSYGYKYDFTNNKPYTSDDEKNKINYDWDSIEMFQTRIMEEYEWSKDPTDHGVPPEWFKIVKEGDTYYVKSGNEKLEIYTTPEKKIWKVIENLYKGIEELNPIKYWPSCTFNPICYVKNMIGGLFEKIKETFQYLSYRGYDELKVKSSSGWNPFIAYEDCKSSLIGGCPRPYNSIGVQGTTIHRGVSMTAFAVSDKIGHNINKAGSLWDYIMSYSPIKISKPVVELKCVASVKIFGKQRCLLAVPVEIKLPSVGFNKSFLDNMFNDLLDMIEPVLINYPLFEGKYKTHGKERDVMPDFNHLNTNATINYVILEHTIKGHKFYTKYSGSLYSFKAPSNSKSKTYTKYDVLGISCISSGTLTPLIGPLSWFIPNEALSFPYSPFCGPSHHLYLEVFYTVKDENGKDVIKYIAPEIITGNSYEYEIKW